MASAWQPTATPTLPGLVVYLHDGGKPNSCECLVIPFPLQLADSPNSIREALGSPCTSCLEPALQPCCRAAGSLWKQSILVTEIQLYDSSPSRRYLSLSEEERWTGQVRFWLGLEGRRNRRSSGQAFHPLTPSTAGGRSQPAASYPSWCPPWACGSSPEDLAGLVPNKS